MRVLVACEFSGIVREEFKAKGHDSWSCDFEPTEVDGDHYQCDVREVIDLQWDMTICFPPCTYLCGSGARWWKDRKKEQKEAIDFVKFLFRHPKIDKIALENPVGILSREWELPYQIIQPWEFGHGETKATCLWLKNLPPLRSTNIVESRENKIHKMAPSKNRSKDRSRTYLGIAKAMADQWG